MKVDILESDRSEQNEQMTRWESWTDWVTKVIIQGINHTDTTISKQSKMALWVMQEDGNQSEDEHVHKILDAIEDQTI